MKIKSFGCSFFFGTDLADCSHAGDPHHTASRSTWPALLAQRLGAEYQCKARGGVGNLYILYNLLARISEHTADRDDVYIIGWTHANRFDYVDPLHPGSETPRTAWRTFGHRDTRETVTRYYRELHSELRDKLVALTYIDTAISVLEDAGIPFVMTCIDDTVLDQTWHAPEAVKLLQRRVAPYIQDFQGQNFLTWSESLGYPQGATGHPLESAHAAAADLMWPRVKLVCDTRSKAENWRPS